MHFFLLVLRVPLSSTLDGVYESPGITEILSETCFKFGPRQRTFGLTSTLVLVPSEADPTIKEQSGKGCAVQASGAGGVEALLTEVVALHMGLSVVEVSEPSLHWPFLRSFLEAWIRAIGLCLEERIHAKLCDSLKIFFDILGGSRGGDWSGSTGIAWCLSFFFGARMFLWLAVSN